MKTIAKLLSIGLLLCTAQAFSQNLFKIYQSNDLYKFKEVAGKNPSALYKSDKDGLMLIHHTAYDNRQDFLDIMLDNKMDINTKDVKGLTPLMYATLSGNIEMCRYIISKGANINMQSTYGISALFVAAQDHPKIAELLLENNADPNLYNIAGRSLLMLISITELGQKFIDLGAEVNHKDNNQRTALMYASGCPFSENYFPTENKNYIELLLKNGAKVNEKDEISFTALHYAARENFQSAIEPLLNAGASINSQSLAGMTPLYLAALNNRQEIVQLLLQKGADPSIESILGDTPLEAAQKKGYVTVVNIIKNFK
jgi:ankyrin repeat protein